LNVRKKKKEKECFYSKSITFKIKWLKEKTLRKKLIKNI